MSPARTCPAAAGVAATLLLAAAPPAFAHGGEHGGESTSQLLSAWSLEPAVLASAAVALLLFARGFWRLRRRGRVDHAPWWRAALFILATSVVVAALISPIDSIGEEHLLWMHMLQHVLVGDVAPALGILALRGPLVLFLLPAPTLAWLARHRGLRRTLALLQRPLVCVAVWGVVMGCWHVPPVYDYALAHQTIHDVEHLSFLLAGALVWTVLIDPARHGRLSRPRRIGVALSLFALGQALADVLLFSFQPYYPSYAHLGDALWGISPVLDQRLAGAVMMGDQLLTLGICVAVLLRLSLRPLSRPAASEAR